MKKGLLTIEEAARHLGVSKVSLRRWTNDGRLACVRVGPGRERRFRLEDLDHFVNESTASRRHRRQDRPGRSGKHETARHISLYFKTLDEHWELFRSYFLDHVERRQPVAYIYDDGRGDNIRARIRGEGIDPDTLDDAGLLRLMPASQAYLRTGSFSAGRMIDFMESVILDMRSLGHSAGLLTGETNWTMSGAEGVEGFLDYEQRLNEMLTRYPGITVVCHYDLSCVNAELIFHSLCCHPHVQLPGRLVPGYYTGT